MDSTAEKGTLEGTRFVEEEGHHNALSNSKTNETGTDAEKASSYAQSTTGLDHKSETAKAERKLVFKLDILILPLAVLLYLSAYLDRGNLGNARLQGLQATVLNGSDTNYSLALSCFFITYIIFSIPGTLLAKQINPSTSIAIGAAIWSVAATCQAASFSPAGLYVCRLFVGIGEALFGQAMAFYLSIYYQKTELAKRVGLFISAGALSGAFGGLISFGVSNMTNTSIVQWRILFLIEGIPSVVLAIVVYLFLPSRPATTKYLNEDERLLAVTRMNRNNSYEAHSGIDWKAVRRAFTDWKTYVVAVMYSCMNLGLGSVGGFLPTIIKGFGYTNAQAQLYTVPPYVVALVTMLLISTYSDRYQTRGVCVASVFLIGIVGWSILYAVTPVKATESMLAARYFGCICVVVSGYSNIPLVISWQAGNTGSESQRAVSLGMLNSVGQCLSILAAFLFPTAEGPQFLKGGLVNIIFSSVGFCIAIAMTLYYRRENARRDAVEGKPGKEAVNSMEEYDLAFGFRYVV